MLTAVLATAINDHVGKLYFPGVLTWKISDFAGLFYFPFFVTTLLGSIRYLTSAAALTGAVFGTLKLIGLSIGPFHISKDPTDLVALVCVGLAIWYGRRRWPEAA